MLLPVVTLPYWYNQPKSLHPGTARRFDVVIIDEAAQAVEPSTLVPLMLGCKQVGRPERGSTVHRPQCSFRASHWWFDIPAPLEYHGPQQFLLLCRLSIPQELLQTRTVLESVL